MPRSKTPLAAKKKAPPAAKVKPAPAASKRKAAPSTTNEKAPLAPAPQATRARGKSAPVAPPAPSPAIPTAAERKRETQDRALAVEVKRRLVGLGVRRATVSIEGDAIVIALDRKMAKRLAAG